VQRGRGAEGQRGRGAEGQRGRGAEGQRKKEIKMFFYEQKHNNSERAKILVIILICVNLSSSVFICGKNLTNDDNRQFDDITHILTMKPDLI